MIILEEGEGEEVAMKSDNSDQMALKADFLSWQKPLAS